MKTETEKDIWDWITNFIEVNNEFYDYKFPPCPYAKAARLNGLVDVKTYDRGNPYSFVKNQVDDLLKQQKFSVRVIAFPHWMRWLYPLHWAIQRLNQKAIGQDCYIQYGKIVDIVKHSHFIVIVNNLTGVLSAHSSLRQTDYYNNWSDKHYYEVVVRRQHAYEKHKGKII